MLGRVWESCSVAVGVDVGVDDGQGVAEFGWGGWLVGGGEGDEHPVVDLGVLPRTSFERTYAYPC